MMIQPVFCRLLVLAAVFLAAAVPAAADEQEVLFGTYLYTDRNLATHGATVALRYWLADPSRPFGLLYPAPMFWGLEIRGGRLVDPETAWEGAFLLNLRAEAGRGGDLGAGAFIGVGGSYSGADYVRTSKWNFISRGGIFLRFQGLIVQGACEHRSNAGLSWPNRGLDVFTGSVGFRF